MVRSIWNGEPAYRRIAMAVTLAGACVAAAAPVPALAGGGGQTVQHSKALTLSGAPSTMTPLVSSGGRDYLVASIGGTPWLLSDAGGAWKAYNTGITDYVSGEGEGHDALAVARAIPFIAYVDTSNGLKLAFARSGLGGPFSTTVIVPAAAGKSCGPGVNPTAPAVAVVGGTLAVAFEAAPQCNASGSTHGQDVYVAATSLQALAAGESPPRWHVAAVTAGYAQDGYFPALAADGDALDLAYQGSNGTIYFVAGRPRGTGFAWPAQPGVVVSLGTDRKMDRPKMTLAAADHVDVLALYAGGNTSDVWAATNASGRWTSGKLAAQRAIGDRRPAAALGACGPAVVFEAPPNNAAGNHVVLATFAGGAWRSRTAGTVQASDDAMWPALAATPRGMDLTYLNDNSGSPTLFAIHLACLPTVASILPSGGPAAGGTTVTIRGSGFTGATQVIFGGSVARGNSGSGGPAASFTVVSGSRMTAVSPPGSGTVDVTVVTPAGASAPNPGDRFSYQAATGGGAPSGGAPTSGFGDLGGYGWASGAIRALAKQGIVRGTRPGAFDPGGQVTRVQFAAILQRLFHLPAPSRPVAFSDVPHGYWGYAAVEAASPYFDYYRLPSGSYAFRPDRAFDRQDVATVIVRVLAKSGKLRLVSAATAQGILAKVTDVARIAPALKIYVATAIKEGILSGFPDGSFRPHTALTRAQVAVMLQRLEIRSVTGSGS